MRLFHLPKVGTDQNLHLLLGIYSGDLRVIRRSLMVLYSPKKLREQRTAHALDKLFTNRVRTQRQNGLLTASRNRVSRGCIASR